MSLIGESVNKGIIMAKKRMDSNLNIQMSKLYKFIVKISIAISLSQK